MPTDNAILMEIQRDLGRVESKIDGIHKRLDDKDELCEQRRTRIEELEHHHERQKGALWIVAGISSILALIGKWLWGELTSGRFKQ